jgi:hypothetical protein
MRRIFNLLLSLVFLFALSCAFVEVKADAGGRPIQITYIYDNHNVFERTDYAEYGAGYVHSFSNNENYEFAYWVVNGAVRKDLPSDYQFTVTTEMKLQAVFSPMGKHTVLFIDSNGAVIDIQFVDNGATASEPGNLPDKPGLKISETNRWSPASLENITDSTVFVLQYELESDESFTLTVDEETHGAYDFNQVVTVEADPEKAGVAFSHWEEDGKIVSFSAEYTFTMLYDRALTAVYDNERTVTPLVYLSDALRLRDGHVSFLGQAYLPGPGYELVEAGFLFTNGEGDLEKDAAGVTVATHPKPNAWTDEFLMSFPNSLFKRVRAFITVKNEGGMATYYSEKTYSAPANLPIISLNSEPFAIDAGEDLVYSVAPAVPLSGVSHQGEPLTAGEDYVYDEENGLLTIKGQYLIKSYRFGSEALALIAETETGENAGFVASYDNPRYRVLNGGFETGGIYGWNSFQIWKNESGMIAWTDDRVVSGGYFDQGYSYERDGDFNLGIYGGSITKDSGQERMGHLRSSNFILGGSGWISFKLGGGADSAFAYVSVRRSADNFEVARFGNPRFKESGGADTEARLFKYYFDLSTVAEIGENLYFVISDTSSYEWCVLSADSFFTYYEEAPTPGEKELAVNIVPEIPNIDTADNSIKNGYFNDGLNHWSDANSTFAIDGSGFARSDGKIGDGDTGVLRSSAFSVTENKYLRFGWAGGLKYDKQIFVSVKEVGTNIEVLRFVRRDNLWDKSNENFDNHMLDLSGLDESKLYYLEFADNTKSGWGVSFIKEVRLVSKEEYDSVVIPHPGDRAVLIHGLETEFAYNLPYGSA